MGIVPMVPPASATAPKTGNRGRLSQKDLNDLAESIRRGEIAGDGVPATKRTTAAQRAKSAAELVEREFGVTSSRIVWANTEGEGFLWALGPQKAVDPSK